MRNDRQRLGLFILSGTVFLLSFILAVVINYDQVDAFVSNIEAISLLSNLGDGARARHNAAAVALPHGQT